MSPGTSLLSWFVLCFFPGLCYSGIVDPPIGCVSYSGLSTLPLCSGRGYCVDINNSTLRINTANVPGTKCICDDGWTGLVDWVNMQNHDCGQRIVVIKIGWGLVSFFALLLFILANYKLVTSFLFFRKRNKPEISSSPLETPRITGRDIQSSRKKNNPRGICGDLRAFYKWQVSIMSSYAFVHSLALFLLAMLRVIKYESQLIGYQVAPTLLFMIQDQAFWMQARINLLSWLKIRGSLCHFSADDARSVKTMTAHLTSFTQCLWIPDLLRLCCVFSILFVPLQSQLLTLLYFQSLTFSLFTSSIVFYHTAKKVRSILLNGFEKLPSKPKRDRERALKGIQTFLSEVTVGAISTIPSWILISLWPFLRANIGYTCFQLTLPPLTISTTLLFLKPPNSTENESTTESSKKLLSPSTPSATIVHIELEATPKSDLQFNLSTQAAPSLIDSQQ